MMRLVSSVTFGMQSHAILCLQIAIDAVLIPKRGWYMEVKIMQNRGKPNACLSISVTICATAKNRLLLKR